MNRALMFFIIICGMAFCSCNNLKTTPDDSVLSRTFTNCIWERFDFVKADITIEEETSLDLSLDICFTEAYKPHDFTMVFSVFDTNGNPYRCKEYKFKLKDKEGNWNIEKKDDCYTFNFPINSDLLLTDAGTYKFQIEYRMPITPLEGVKSLRLNNR